MDKVQSLSADLIEASAELLKASREKDVKSCINISERINMINEAIAKVMNTYKISC